MRQTCARQHADRRNRRRGGRSEFAVVAVVVAGISISPNTFVIAIDPGRRRMLVHQLVPSGERLLGEEP